MLSGILAALGAGLAWGLVFLTPLLLPDYPGAILSFGRYTAFGLIALLPAWLDRKRILRLQRQDWMAAGRLALVGNIIYYAALASAIQLADAPLPTMLIGTLPVVIAICSNWSPLHASEAIAWKRLVLPLGVIFTGLLLVNASELEHIGQSGRDLGAYVRGGLVAVIAVAAWTWYPIMNGRYLKQHPEIASSTWATVQGLATLPMASLGFAAYGAWQYFSGIHGYDYPVGPHPALFIGLMLTLGLLASWLGTLLWNHASQQLPTSLAGQLIVFETLSALLYAFLWRGNMPPQQILLGILLLCTGVAFAVRAFQPVKH
jgi:drug/metabolite transporter (DMT)-like permease